jgi:hypothetical protein
MRDARVICGYDVRRTGFWPTDSARADAFMAQYGGTLSAMPIGNVAIALQWESEDGELVTATGATVAIAFEQLRAALHFTDTTTTRTED